jgi:trimethylamine--corrinoid protein Co-methyltransferase
MINESLQKIHDATMRVLERTGIKFHHPDAGEILKKHGIRENNGAFCFTEEQLMFWVRKSPETFTFKARNPVYDAVIGGDNYVCAPGYGAPQICGPDGSKRNATINDYVRLSKLYQVNPLYKANGGIIVQPGEVPPEISPVIMHYAALTHTDKCLQAPSGNKEQMELMMEMSKIVFGNLELPRMITIVNTNSPLQLDKVMTDTLFVFCRNKQPVAITAAVMAGTTGPITMAGTLVIANAEVLATIALAQMIQPGTPVVYGNQSTTSDMATGSMAGGSPEGALCYKYGAQLAKFYRLPGRGGGAISDARVLNGQSGYESMVTYLSSVINGMNYIIHSAGIMDGFSSMSYEKMVMDFEINRIVERYHRGVEVTPETVQEDMIHNVGHGGNFMTEKHTFKYCRKETFIPKIGTRGKVDNPATQFDTNIKRQLEAMWSQYEKPVLPESVLNDLESLLAKKGIKIADYFSGF